MNTFNTVKMSELEKKFEEIANEHLRPFLPSVWLREGLARFIKAISALFAAEMAQKDREIAELSAEVQEYRKHMQVMPLLRSCFEFVQAVHDSKEPKMTKIVLRIADEQTDVPMVSFWAAVGENNPIDRISALRQRVAELEDHINTKKLELSHLYQRVAELKGGGK